MTIITESCVCEVFEAVAADFTITEEILFIMSSENYLSE